MRIVYATGTPQSFEFAVSAGRDALPAGARVMAVCDGSRYEGRLDGSTFDQMSDQEYYALQALIEEARRSERSAPRPGALDNLRGFFRRLTGSPSATSA